MAVVLKLYVRTGCHLCEDMLGQLQQLQPELGFGLETIEITGQPSLELEYGEKVPVLMGQNNEICHYFLDPEALKRYIELQ
ncbi:MAG: glutaredoxin family protein [Gammaproteobacteria bacterium]|nr:glutaredoxin family protein [Gammaproteobacteria bacterium]MDH5778310.1 glutaredoxin family protein [Gammaproteobacteria bacterium]